jgi:hypothetical protein
MYFMNSELPMKEVCSVMSEDKDNIHFIIKWLNVYVIVKLLLWRQDRSGGIVIRKWNTWPEIQECIPGSEGNFFVCTPSQLLIQRARQLEPRLTAHRHLSRG